MTSHQSLAEWSQWFWPIFANHLWQATLFAFVVLIAMKLFKRAPARFRYFLWLGALTKFLIPSAMLVWLIGQSGVDLSLPFKAVQSAASTAASGMATAYTETRKIFHTSEPVSGVERPVMTNAAADGAAANHHAEFYLALTVVWLLGVMAFIALWLVRRRYFSLSLHSGRVIASGREFDALKRARSWLFVNRDVGLVASSRVRETGVWGAFHPVIVLPEGIAGRLSDEEIEAVMMHELVHVLHRDNLIGTLQMIVCSLLWFHPLAWLIDRRLLAEREMWCDETVIRLGGEPKLYAASLWKVVQFGLGWPVAGVSRAAGSNLKRRLERMLILNNQQEVTVARRVATYASFFVLGILYITVGLPGASTFAQRNKIIEATNKKELSQGVKGGVEDAIPGGVSGGMNRGAERNAKAGASSGVVKSGTDDGIDNGVEGGRAGGVDGAKTVQTATQDDKGAVESQRLNKWELIKQAPEFLMKIENRNDSPLQITDARVRIMGWEFKKETGLSAHGNAQLKVMTDEENEGTQDLKSANVIIAQFNITLVNKTDRRITGVILEYKNPGLRGGRFQIGPPILPHDTPLDPYGSYVFGKDMLHHHSRATDRVQGGVGSASDDPTLFTIRVAGVKFENEPHFNQLNSSTPPKITYKESARYTQEALEKKIEGTVILSIVFGADGQIGEIEVVQGLPYGLTESAIEAAKKIRFEPATKDGLPVSERATRGYHFITKRR